MEIENLNNYETVLNDEMAMIKEIEKELRDKRKILKSKKELSASNFSNFVNGLSVEDFTDARIINFLDDSLRSKKVEWKDFGSAMNGYFSNNNIPMYVNARDLLHGEHVHIPKSRTSFDSQPWDITEVDEKSACQGSADVVEAVFSFYKNIDAEFIIDVRTPHMIKYENNRYVPETQNNWASSSLYDAKPHLDKINEEWVVVEKNSLVGRVDIYNKTAPIAVFSSKNLEEVLKWISQDIWNHQ